MWRPTLAVSGCLGARLIGAAPASASSIGSLTVVNGSPSAAAGARTQYVAKFVTSTSGGLSSSGGTVTVTFPNGTAFTNFNGGGVFVDSTNTRIGNCPTPNATTRVSTCTIFGSIGPSTTARVEFNGITNPTTPAAYQLTASTSADTTVVSSADYAVVGANTLSNITVNNASPSAGAGARSQYVIKFATTAPGGLAATAASSIDVTFPNGTTFGNFNGGGVFVDSTNTRIGNCSTPNATTRVSTCTIFGSIGPSTTARLEYNGITTPTAPGSTYSLTVATSSDTAPTSSLSYSVVPANTLSNI